MFRNQYDTDITTWSPQGRLHQVEYAMEAVKQGSAVVGISSGKHAVLATLQRSPAELSSSQKKLFAVDRHVGIAIAGLTADARVLGRFMRTECLHHKYVYSQPMPLSRLVLTVANKCQVSTQRASKRPYGVGLLVTGVDDTGAHLYQTCPSGNYYEFRAMAIGARSQSAKTYLERHFERYEDLSLEQLCDEAIRALRETVSSSKDTELNAKNCAISFVGADRPFTIVDGEDVLEYIARALPPEPPRSDEPGEEDGAAGGGGNGGGGGGDDDGDGGGGDGAAPKTAAAEDTVDGDDAPAPMEQ